MIILSSGAYYFPAKMLEIWFQVHLYNIKELRYAFELWQETAWQNREKE